jgi:serine phosphatase RsbU (regulator of sigma subunit)
MDSSIEAVNRGAYAYIEKPLNIANVTTTVQAALEKQQLERQNAQLLERLKAIEEITDSALPRLELNDLLDTLLQRAERHLKAQTSAILLLDETGTRLDVRRARGVEETELGELAASLMATFARRVLRDGRAVVVPDLAQEANLAGSYLYRRGTRSLLEVPMSVHDRVIGVAHVDKTQPYEFTPDDIGLFEKFADRAATLIENARLYEGQRRAATENQTLYQISEELVRRMEVRERLAAIATHLSRVTGASRCMVGLREGETLGVEFYPDGDGDDRWEIEAAEWGETLKGVLRTGEPTLWHRGESGPLASDLDETCEIHASLLLPLASSGQVIGVIGLDEPGRVYRFSKDHERLGRIIAAQAAVAIQNARVFERERTIARTLQEIFLPKEPPQIPGFDIAPQYVPAFAEEQVGGDYFDFIEMGNGRFGLVLGDVCGKGVAAALYTATAKYTLRAYALEEPSPARVMTRLNATLAQQMPEECAFVTLIYALLDTREGTLTYVNAAHPPPLLFEPRSGEFQELTATGALVGAWPELEYTQRQVTLPPGSVLAFYTDGVTEARRGTQMLETSGVRRVIQASVGCSVREIARQIYQAARRQSGGNLRDDVAIVVLKRRDGADLSAPA